MASHIPIPSLNALASLRFLAIIHIFIYHLWLNAQSSNPAPFDRILESFHDLPAAINTFFSHGWLSTSFFFTLSGFMLAVMYCKPNGQLKITPQQFWLRRLARTYPIHIVLTVYLIYANYSWHVSQGVDNITLVGSAVATLLLVQSWYPPWISFWNWPAWALSTLIFLYICAPWVFKYLLRMPPYLQKIWLISMPMLSLLPFAYVYYFTPVNDWGESIGKISSFPPFWLFHFSAGVLLAGCLFSAKAVVVSPSKWLISLGDIAFFFVIAIAFQNTLPDYTKMFLRHGLILPLYLMIIFDLARGHGILPRLLAFKGSKQLGDISFSIFIWQAVIIQLCWFSIGRFPWVAPYQLPAAIIGGVIIAAISTYAIEQPLSRWIRLRFTKI